MKKTAILFAAILSIAAIQAAAQDAKQEVAHVSPAPAVQPVATDAPAPKTITADARFSDLYTQAVALQKTIEDIEREHAIRELRERQQKLVLQIQAWIREHKVEGWKYDQDTKTFSEVKKPDPPKSQ